ncbi:hypothetical protein DFH08DRAFT_304558 [Mycena albidolilacea]|uniref:Uncharacterized protein n=1 Tax=Mycena albidolilacea TaxID=1033008 RepID=A0AAD7EJS9_9AGAR|nr:hypothetical protein DFH08DRAFT_304558 [Mycena albidolilacea]
MQVIVSPIRALSLPLRARSYARCRTRPQRRQRAISRRALHNTEQRRGPLYSRAAHPHVSVPFLLGLHPLWGAGRGASGQLAASRAQPRVACSRFPQTLAPARLPPSRSPPTRVPYLLPHAQSLLRATSTTPRTPATLSPSPRRSLLPSPPPPCLLSSTSLSPRLRALQLRPEHPPQRRPPAPRRARPSPLTRDDFVTDPTRLSLFASTSDSSTSLAALLSPPPQFGFGFPLRECRPTWKMGTGVRTAVHGGRSSSKRWRSRQSWRAQMRKSAMMHSTRCRCRPLWLPRHRSPLPPRPHPRPPTPPCARAGRPPPPRSSLLRRKPPPPPSARVGPPPPLRP